MKHKRRMTKTQSYMLTTALITMLITILWFPPQCIFKAEPFLDLTTTTTSDKKEPPKIKIPIKPDESENEQPTDKQ